MPGLLYLETCYVNGIVWMLGFVVRQLATIVSDKRENEASIHYGEKVVKKEA